MDSEKPFEDIDIEKVFKNRNPKLYKWLPGFVMRYIKNVIHQDEMNRIINMRGNAKGIDFVNLILHEMGVKVSFSGLENIPKSGPVIIASNHPLGGLDGLILIKVVGEMRSDVKFIVNDILTNLPSFEEVFVPVNKLGSNAKSNLEMIDKLYASDKAVLIFPAGLCSRKIGNTITDLPWSKSFISKAQKYSHPIVPVFIRAHNSSWFYNLSKFRTKLGIKANVEMFYLADEMFKQKGKKIELVFGKPILPETLTKQYSQKEWAEIVKEFVYQIDKKPQIEFEKFLESRT
jgi:putative hemolysin